MAVVLTLTSRSRSCTRFRDLKRAIEREPTSSIEAADGPAEDFAQGVVDEVACHRLVFYLEHREEILCGDERVPTLQASGDSLPDLTMQI